MTREIRFRAWDGKNKKMFTVDYLEWDDKAKLIGTVGTLEDDDTRDLADVELMQYTGLKDENGKEICEGDILGHPNRGNRVVVWEDEFAGFRTDPPDGRPCFDSFSEIIGNVYEQPELLK